jgi:predicted esterase
MFSIGMVAVVYPPSEEDRMEHMTRRRFIGWGLAGAATACSGAWLAGSGLWAAEANPARLRSRPGKPKKAAQIGLHDFDLVKGKNGVLSVPKGYKPEKPVPLIIMLHGGIGRDSSYNVFCELAAEDGIAVLMPDSRGRTWDFLLGGFGPDIAFLDRALAYAFERLAVDPKRLAFAGFSDGASYALTVGLANGDLFTHVMAFSPGFMVPPARVGKPRIFVSHGTQDEILPFGNSRGQTVPQLKKWGYETIFREFAGNHTIPAEVGREAFRWFLK